MLSTITESFYGYDTISLKLYFQVAKSGNLELIQITGKYNPEKCFEVWDEIIKRNAEESGSGKYNSFLDKSKSYNQLFADLQTIKGMLMYLCIRKNQEYIDYLGSRGYKIPTDKGEEAYMEAVYACMIKSDNIVTKLNSKQKEIVSITEEKPGKEETLAVMLVYLSYALGLSYTLKEDLLLAEYNAFQKILKAKQAAAKK
jgi:hypothetical protein